MKSGWKDEWVMEHACEQELSLCILSESVETANKKLCYEMARVYDGTVLKMCVLLLDVTEVHLEQ